MTTPPRTHHTCVVVDTVTSSRPSSPRKTAASLPRSAKTPASSGAMRASAQPTAAYVGWAGLVRGPRKLNAVPMPRSRRGTAVWRKDGWKVWAKQNVMPASDATSTTRSGGSDRSTPRASSTSAEPDDDDAARLPCLTSRTPAAAATIEDIVEMLTVWARSPPVPTMSRLGPGTSMRRACASICSARPRISSTLSPLARSPMRKPATWEGVASPPMIWAMAHSAVGRSRSRPAMRSVRSGGPGRRVRRHASGRRARPNARAWRWPTSARSGRAGAGRQGRPGTRRRASCPAGDR